ncbi:hypothetical protein A1O3_08166 [Capronia epimyces CBS 606.96]|uniref:Nuclear protein DGCR14 n=1 Tax=Capronia epimyces CBS 606.96 TaxID=1182542 RepID=W9XSE7_9EURO|nr:uncharacterized protein A1O3_08166 [Capronia epimyces CBS 606.96]EXJ79881.1 hypothetical protein A1O3_08166 [Capronia epimyces CBS 606.96]
MAASTSPSPSPSTQAKAVVKRGPSQSNSNSNAVSLMPPPPFKRIKRPAKVLDEDEYTSALSDIIARDYFPGLLESQAQHEYLAALESGDESWIAEAAQKLRNAGAPAAHMRRSNNKGSNNHTARNTRFDNYGNGNGNTRFDNYGNGNGNGTPSATPRWGTTTPTSGGGGVRGGVADTPVGSYAGSDTPATRNVHDIGRGHGDAGEDVDGGGGLDTAGLSLGAFQAKYTSEDNESFNTLLDKQNLKRRQKHAYLWTQDQRVPSARLIAYREREAQLLLQQGEQGQVEEEVTASGGGGGGGGVAGSSSGLTLTSTSATNPNEKAVVPSMTTGATDARPARPDAWLIRRPDNSFMFPATSVDEDTPALQTVHEVKEQLSKAGPKHVVHANTRFPPVRYFDEPGPIPPSPSLNTEIIARRDAAAKGRPAASESSEFGFDVDAGSETPRVNGYAFVDEDEPETVHQPQTQLGPSYRDLLAGQVGADATPNPFKIGEIRRREELHLRMVDSQARRKRQSEKERESASGSGSRIGGMTPVAAAAGNMTPAARRLMEKLGARTPSSASSSGGRGGGGAAASRDMWTPVRTPRRKK